MSQPVQVKLYKLQRPLNGNPFKNCGADYTKHWALLIEYYENENGKLVKRTEEIVEGIKSGSVLKVQNGQYLESQRKEFESETGERTSLLEGDEFFSIPSNYFTFNFCQSFNEKKITYKLFNENCQTVVTDFMMQAGIETSLPETTADTIKKSTEVCT